MDAIVVMNAQGRIVDWSPRAETMFGWRREDVLGRLLSALIVSPRPRGPLEDAPGLFSASGCPAVLDARRELTAIRRDGEEVEIELSMTRWREPGEEDLVLGFIRDISRRREASTRLVASEARFRAAIDAVQGVLWTNNARGQMEGEQPAWAALTGRDPRRVRGLWVDHGFASRTMSSPRFAPGWPRSPTSACSSSNTGAAA
ncbi:PAS domain-containing protein [Caulobacter segnis]